LSVLVDTCVWSLGLRRKEPLSLSARQRRLVEALAKLVSERQEVFIGPIKQETLSGVRNAVLFGQLRKYFAKMHEVPMEPDDYVRAARFFNTLVSKGITGKSVDLMICAVAYRLNIRIFTTDKDFTNFARVLPIRLYVVE